MEVNRLVNLLAGVAPIENTIATGLRVAAPGLTNLAQRRGLLAKVLVMNDIFVRGCSRLTRFVCTTLIVTSGFTVAAAQCDTPYAPPSTAMPAAQIELSLTQVVNCEEGIWP